MRTKHLRFFVIILFLIGVGLYTSLRYFSTKNDVAEVSLAAKKLPITGTFFMPDYMDNLVTEPIMDKFFKEMSETGIDTIVGIYPISLVNRGDKGLVCEDNINAKLIYFKLAHKYQMRVYVSPVTFDTNSVNWWLGDFRDLKNQEVQNVQYAIANCSQTRLARLQTTLEQNGIPWSTIKGWDLGEGSSASLANPNGEWITYLKRQANFLKNLYPDKEGILSPYVYEADTYAAVKAGYDNVYRLTQIKIIATQDSMGTAKVTSYAKSAELYKALADSTREANAADPNKGAQAWANIETFRPTDNRSLGEYRPSDITKISNQIAAAAPHVSKMITWIYAHTMLSVGEFDSTYSWTNQYKPENAVLRKKLRNDYINFYTSTPTVTPTPTPTPTPTITPTPTPTVTPTPTPTVTPTPTPTPTPTVTPTPTPSQLQGDLNNDGVVNNADYNILISKFGSNYSVFDYNILVANYGRSRP